MKITETPRPPLVTTQCLLCGQLVYLGDNRLQYQEVMVKHIKENHRGDNALFESFVQAMDRLESHCGGCATDAVDGARGGTHRDGCPVLNGH